ncbi:hypothetical protein B0J18DRAFT_244303 [Chaetomium sp. MPI-SDFR-AT-0129]|nr:hypothetical protein B0J18DRAFT_244303 [Chaetomium sp. MPI-SDFR-AT-0129]
MDVWRSNGAVQVAVQGLREVNDEHTLTSNRIPQPYSGGDTGFLTSAQDPANCLSSFEGVFSSAQHQDPTYAFGLPSPAMTAPAASPTGWHIPDGTSTTTPWTPVSPVTSNTGEVAGELANPRYYPHPAIPTPAAFEPSFCVWPGDNALQLGHHPVYPEGSTIASDPYDVCVGTNAAWAGHIMAPSQPNTPFPSTLFGNMTTTTIVTHGHAHPPMEAEVMVPNSQNYSHPTKEHQPSRSPPNEPSNETTLPPSPKAATTGESSSPSLKSESSDPKSPSTTQNKGPSLRTATRRVKRPPSLPKPGESLAHQRARTNHNLVEQQYRHRLHARFEALLDALPEGILDDDQDEDGSSHPASSSSRGKKGGAPQGDARRASDGGGGAGAVKGKNNRRMSKVDVLSKAERVIRFLESDVERMKNEMEAMKQDKTMALKRKAAEIKRGGQGDHGAWGLAN